MVAGPYHETFRQLVESSIYYDTIVNKIKKYDVKVKEVEVITHPQNVSNIVGYKRENIEKLKNIYDVDLTILQDIKCSPDKIEVIISKKFKEFKDDKEDFEDRKGKRAKAKVKKHKEKEEKNKENKDNNKE